jgi:hypothetical protein
MITQNQQFDTIRLHIPEEAISNVDLELFSIPTSYNAFTQKEIWKGEKQLHLINTGKGINYVKHVPKFKLYDIQISAKILREDYYKGIEMNTIENAIFALENRMNCEIDQQQFIEQGKILKCDNTFNLKVEGPLEDYLEALDFLAVQGKRTKIETYTDAGNPLKINSVVIGKETKFQQKITFYNKREEAHSICHKMPGGYIENIEPEYGMKVADFDNYFMNRIRCELKVSKFAQLRKFYTNKSKGDVYLQEILKSKNNAVYSQWENFISKGDTAIQIKAIDKMYSAKKTNINDFSEFRTYQAILPLLQTYKGDARKIIDNIEKVWYLDKKSKKMSKTVREEIVGICAKYKQRQLRAEKGGIFINELGENFAELQKQVRKI